MFKLERYSKNPILSPVKDHAWESKMVFNCASVLKDGKVHLLYRARGEDKINNVPVSRIGHAILKEDGITLEKRYAFPVYEPKESYERAGCEDPRITEIEGEYFMLYTAYFGTEAPKEYEKEKYNIAMASSPDLLNWKRHGILLPEIKSPEKNGIIFPRKINGNYVIYYRVEPDIYVAYSKSLEKPEWFGHKKIISPRKGFWDGWKIGAGAPPIETENGWLLIYHGIDKEGFSKVKTGYGTIDRERTYRLGVMLIDKNNPEKILYRSEGWILEPEEKYEKEGMVPNVVFTCGAVIIGDTLFVYYGGADTVIGVASCKLANMLEAIKENVA
jgi:beta-1,2-mannobiose phosphorylase / 1,2-beta-oligomannan phosphorylase